MKLNGPFSGDILIFLVGVDIWLPDCYNCPFPCLLSQQAIEVGGKDGFPGRTSGWCVTVSEKNSVKEAVRVEKR